MAQKFSVTLKNYVAQNGYTILIDVSNQQSAVMWALPNTDVTEATVQALHTSSGVAAPAPSAPSATRPGSDPAEADYSGRSEARSTGCSQDCSDEVIGGGSGHCIADKEALRGLLSMRVLLILG